MPFVRKKQIKGKDYYYLVKSYRSNGKNKQKVLKYIGSVVPNSKTLNSIIAEEFNERKIQQLIRKDIKFKPFNVDMKFLQKAESLREKFYLKLDDLTPISRKQLIERFKTGYTYHSCSIEGNTLSRHQVDLVINKKESIAGKKLIEIQEVSNHKEALEYMMTENGDLSEEFIKRLHGVLTRDIHKFKLDPKDDEYDPDFIEGDYRKDQRYIKGADFIPVIPDLINFEMKDLLKFYNENKYTLHPLELASEFHLRFVVIHPFADGNGRMARLLMNFILDRSKFPMIDISVKNREAYIEALASGDSKKLTKFIFHELESYTKELFN